MQIIEKHNEHLNPFSCLACLQLIYVGDGKCHDFTNNPTCAFDGGDCCLHVIDYEECILCKCIGVNDVVNSNPIVGKQTITLSEIDLFRMVKTDLIPIVLKINQGFIPF